MALPDIVVEAAFDGSTWQTDPTDIAWTNITSYVLHGDGLKTTRGSTSSRRSVDSGAIEFSLKNADRRFDSLYTSSPYYPYVRPGAPVRVRIAEDGYADTYDSVFNLGDNPVWRGTITRVAQRYDIGNRWAWVEVEGQDGFNQMSRAKTIRSVIEAAILDDSPIAYWALDEQGGEVAIDRSTNRRDGEYRAGTTELTEQFEQDDTTHRGIAFDGTHWMTGPIPATAYTTPATIEFLFRPPEDDGQVHTYTMMQLGDGKVDVGGVFQLITTASGTYRVNGYITRPGSAGFNFTVSPYYELDETIHHFAYRLPTTSPAELYIDGVLVHTATLPFANSIANLPGAIIGGTGKHTTSTSLSINFEGWMSQVAIFGADIGAERIAAHADAALTPLDEQTTDQRVGYIVDELGWPASMRVFETGQTILGPAHIEPGDEVLDLLEKIARSEDGLIFIDSQGRLTFRDRYWRYLNTVATTSQITFSDQNTGVTYAEFDLDRDDDLIVNVARYTRRGGVEQVAVDSVSKGLYGEAEDKQSDLLQRTDTEVRALAEWTVATRSIPLDRVTKIRVALHDYSTANQTTVLNLDIGHRVTVARTPQGVGPAISLAFIIQGIKNEVFDKQWWWTAYVSPVPERTKGILLWDTDNWDDSDAVLVY